METCIEAQTWAYTGGIFENHVCAFGKGCPCSGHMYGNMYRDPDMGIHTVAFLRTTYVCLERGVLAVGICMEACIETLTWAYAEGHF